MKHLTPRNAAKNLTPPLTRQERLDRDLKWMDRVGIALLVLVGGTVLGFAYIIITI